MMQKYTILDELGAPVRVLFLPADEIENQLVEGETARPFEESDMPAPVTNLEESGQ